MEDYLQYLYNGITEMKRILYLNILLIFCINNIYAQKISIYEPAILEVEYYRRQVTDTLDRKNDFIGGSMRLRIGRSMSMFYNHKSIWWDSLRCYNRELQWQINQTYTRNRKSYKDEPPYGRNLEVIYKKTKEKKLELYYQGYNAWHYIEDLEMPQWELQDSTKTILDYPCQLAISEYRGRTWYAWFTFDIPISDGPWKLGGLPGLILEAYDSDRDYTFTATGMWQEGIPDIGLYNYAEYDWLKTTRSQYLKIRHRNINTNQAALYSNMYNLKLKGGETNAKPKHRNYDLEERDYHEK